MVNVEAFLTCGVYNQKFSHGNPWGSSVFNVFSAIELSSRSKWVRSPFMSPLCVEFIFTDCIRNCFKPLSSRNVLRVCRVLFSTPRILAFDVATGVNVSATTRVGKRAGFAESRDGRQLFVIVSTRLDDIAGRAQLFCKRFFSGLHCDIVASATGDVKQGENGENPDRATPCQAAAPKRVATGVTTRGRAKAVMPPRAPCLAA